MPPSGSVSPGCTILQVIEFRRNGMKAVTCPRYGSPDVLRILDVERPTPKDDEVLVQVRAASVNAADWHIMRGAPFAIRLAFGLRRPRHPILGMDAAGRVVAVGRSVAKLKPGDEVFGDLSGSGFGAFAEYVAAPEDALAPKPAGLSFEQAAAAPLASVTALQGLRDKGKVQPGQHVLVTGASGGVGTFAVQMAKVFGARVTGVCSTAKVDLVRSIGANHVIDYQRDDFTKAGEQFDLILDAGAYRSVFETRRVLKPGGRYVFVGGGSGPMFQAMLMGRSMLARPNRADLDSVKEMLETGSIVPVVDKVFMLDEAPDAIRYLEEGRATGKVVISMPADEPGAG
jgi:NADPH:quinone reductase-like Zn-dependent oxidoreductase